MLYSELEVQIPEVITEENADFTHILAGALLKYHRQKSSSLIYGHAHLVPFIADFFEERVPKEVNPISVLEKALNGDSPFLPGISRFSIPIEYPTESEKKEIELNKMHLQFKFGYDKIPRELESKIKEDDWTRAINTLFSIQSGDEIVNLDRVNWQRAFGQIPSACLQVAEKRGFEPVIRIPDFSKRYPNYLNHVAPNYLPEGLSTGTVIIESDVGELCGKHSTGGTIAINGSAGKNLGDVSQNINYIIRDFSEKPTQVRNCKFFIGSGIRNGEFGLGQLTDEQIQEYRKDGNEIYERLSYTHKSEAPLDANLNLFDKVGIRFLQ